MGRQKHQDLLPQNRQQINLTIVHLNSADPVIVQFKLFAGCLLVINQIQGQRKRFATMVRNPDQASTALQDQLAIN